MAVANASISAAIDSLARSSFLARASSSSQSSGPAKPSTARTGAASDRAARGLPSQAATSSAVVDERGLDPEA